MQELKNRMKLMCEIRERELIREQEYLNDIKNEKGLAGTSNAIVSFVEGSQNREIVKAINSLLKRGNEAFFDLADIVPYTPNPPTFRQKINDTVDLVNLKAIAGLHDAINSPDFSEENIFGMLRDDLDNASI